MTLEARSVGAGPTSNKKARVRVRVRVRVILRIRRLDTS